jgi:hypothetical protein
VIGSAMAKVPNEWRAHEVFAILISRIAGSNGDRAA